MAYDEGLAERVRNILEGHRGISERKMFGGLAFLVDGKMCCGIMRDDLMVRVPRDGYAAALKKPHARVMDFTGRPMKGFVIVGAAGVDSERQLEAWVNPALEFARSLPPKE